MWSFFSRDPTKDFPYEIGERVDGLDTKSIWTLHKAKKKGTSESEEVSVFVFEANPGADYQLDVAKAAVKRLKTLRHPSILSYLDSLETEKVIYLVTEKVEPLCNRLSKHTEIGSGAKKEFYLSWGFLQIARALSFLNNDGNLRHNNVNYWSIFVNEETGEWKLGSVDYMGIVDSPYQFLPRALQIYQPPDAKENMKPTTKCSVDAWGLGCLIWEVFNEPLSRVSDLNRREKIPKKLTEVYQDLVNSKSQNRPNPSDVIARCRCSGGFFDNALVDGILFLEEIQVKENSDKGRFFGQLTGQLDSFPVGVRRYKILPQLIAAFEYGEAGCAVLLPLLQLGADLPEHEYQKKVVPCVVKLFASNDRATRMKLLQQLDKFVDHLQKNTVNEAIFPQVIRGFLDTNPAVREQTLKSIFYLAPKLDYNNLNVEILRHFAKLQLKDDQGGIRTNTMVCLGKIAQYLHPQTRQKVLINAFLRGTKDPFPPSRIASILALAATQEFYFLRDVAYRILPGLCPLTMDPDKNVRESAFRTIGAFLSKLEKVSEDPNLKESMESSVNAASSSLSSTAATWAGWAMSAVTSKFYRSQAESSNPKSPEDSTSADSKNSNSESNNRKDSISTKPVPAMANVNSDGDWDGWDTETWGDMDQKTVEEKSDETSGTEETMKTEDACDGWEDTEFLPLEEEEKPDNKFEEARKKREEKKLERQKKMEAKRAARPAHSIAAKRL